MEPKQKEFAQEEEDENLLIIPENMRPPRGAEVLQVQESQPVSLSGGSSTVEEAKEESTEGGNLKVEDFNRKEPKPEDQQAVLQSVQRSPAVSQPGDNLRVEEKAKKSKRKSPSSSSAEETNTDATKEVQDRAEWSKEATIALLEAYQRESENNNKKRLSQDHWQAVTAAVSSAENTGTPKTLKQCMDRYKNLNRDKRLKDSSSSVREWYLQTHKIIDWDTNATLALLETHWTYLEPRLKRGRIEDQLNDGDWNIIASNMTLNVTGAQCKDRIFGLIRIYFEKYSGTSASSEWIYKNQIERMIRATLSSSYSSSDSVAPAGGSQNAHP